MSEIDFKYGNSDLFFNELSEFLSIHHTKELQGTTFNYRIAGNSFILEWNRASTANRRHILLTLADRLETTSNQLHYEALLVLVLISNGIIDDSAGSTDSMFTAIRQNCLLMIEAGLFLSIWEYCLMKIRMLKNVTRVLENDKRTQENLNLGLLILHTLLEYSRTIRKDSNSREKTAKDVIVDCLVGEDKVTVLLWNILIEFFAGDLPLIPVGKVTILLAKSTSLVLGEICDYHDRLNETRTAFGLSTCAEDIHEIAESIRQNNSKDNKGTLSDENEETEEISLIAQRQRLTNLGMNNDKVVWSPKISLEKYKEHVSHTKAKYFGLMGDFDNFNLSRLPRGLRQSLMACQQYVYTPLSDHQRQRFSDYISRPFTSPFPVDDSTRAWQLYKGIYPFSDHMASLVKLAVLVYSGNEGDESSPIELINDVCECDNFAQNINAEKARFREVIGKHLSYLLLTLLKYFKLSHIYKFETICNELMQNNILSAIFRFLNREQNMISSESGSYFPLCCAQWWSPPVGKKEFSWNLCFTAVNLTRVVIKLVKHKPWRISEVVTAKSFVIQMRMFKVEIPILQLYSLKLLKIQWKYLTRHWKKTNIRIMSLISLKLRVLINDDWNSTSLLDNNSQEEVIEEETGIFNKIMCRGQYPHEIRESRNVNVDDTFIGDINEWLKYEVFDRTIDWDRLLI